MPVVGIERLRNDWPSNCEFTPVLLSTAIQFLSSSRSWSLIGLFWLLCTMIGSDQGLPGCLMLIVWFQPVPFAPPGASSVLLYALPSSSNAIAMSDTTR